MLTLQTTFPLVVTNPSSLTLTSMMVPFVRTPNQSEGFSFRLGERGSTTRDANAGIAVVRSGSRGLKEWGGKGGGSWVRNGEV